MSTDISRVLEVSMDQISEIACNEIRRLVPGVTIGDGSDRVCRHDRVEKQCFMELDFSDAQEAHERTALEIAQRIADKCIENSYIKVMHVGGRLLHRHQECAEGVNIYIPNDRKAAYLWIIGYIWCSK